MQSTLAPNAIRTVPKLPQLSQSTTPTIPYTNVNIFPYNNHNESNNNTNKSNINNYIHVYGQNATYKPLPPTPFNAHHAINNNNNIHSNPHIDTSLPKTNVMVSNKHHNVNKEAMNRLRANTQRIVYKPLPPTPSNANHSTNKNMCCNYNTKYDKLAINRLRANTQPIIHRPLPATPSNANRNNNNKIKAKTDISPQKINKSIRNNGYYKKKEYKNINTIYNRWIDSNSSYCSSISLSSISTPSISSSICVTDLTPLPSTCVSIPSSSVSLFSLSLSPIHSNIDYYDSIKHKPLPPTPINADHGKNKNEEHLLKCTEDGNNTNISDDDIRKHNNINARRNSYSYSSLTSSSPISISSGSSSIIMPSAVNIPVLSPIISSNEYQSNRKHITWCNTVNIRHFNNSYTYSDMNELDEFKDTEDGALQKTNNSESAQQSDDQDEDDVIKSYVVMTKNVCFDTYSVQKEDNYCFNKYLLLSSKGLISGYYEWSIKIIKCEGSIQEMGVVTNPNIHNIKIINGGITKTAAFGARAVYVNQLEGDNCIYYASYNVDNTQRCYKNLTNKNKMTQNCWAKGDVIKICLDLKKYHISFFLNDKKVRKKISVQSKKTYYPIISFVGNFQYDVTCHVC